VNINRTATGRLGVEVNLPRLAEGVGLDKVSLVVNMKAMVYGVVFQVGDKTGHIYCCHCRLD
jgi:hypothetical protein